VSPDARCPGILRRQDGLLQKWDVRILLLCLPHVTKATLANIRAGDVCANWHSCSEEQMAGARVIQKMDQCGSAQVGICDLTGLCKLMIANLIHCTMASIAVDARFTMSLPAECNQQREQGNSSETHPGYSWFC